jgi:transcriptional regulator with XRE-family HTH domain
MCDDAAGFGGRLRACREAAGLSQEELAERSGLSLRTVGYLEQGHTRWPYRDTVQRLADGLDLPGEARAAFVAAAGRRRGRAVSGVAAEFPDGQPYVDAAWVIEQHAAEFASLSTRLEAANDTIAELRDQLARAQDRQR